MNTQNLISEMYYKYITIDRNGTITIWKHKPRYYKASGVWHTGREKYNRIYNEYVCIGKCNKVIDSTRACWKLNDINVINI